MPTSRTTLTPDALSPGFMGWQANVARLADEVDPDNQGLALDSLMADLLRASFHEAGAYEGTVWLPDLAGQHLVPIWNSGPNSSRIVGGFRQPINAGLVCMVYATEQPFLENDIAHNARQSKLLDLTLGVQTEALLAVPLHFAGACRGVVSCVQLATPLAAGVAKPGFSPDSLAALERTAAVLARLIEFQLLAEVCGQKEA